MKRRKSKKIDKILSPVVLHERINVWHNMEKGKPVHSNALEPLEPSELSRIQKIQLIEYLKYSEALSNVEISDFLKIHRVTVAKRLDEIDERQTLELEEKGFSTWDIARKVIQTTDYIMRKARDNEDYKLYLDAFHKSIDRLQTLGIVFEKPHTLEVQHSIYTEEEQRILISHYRRIELGLPIPSEKGTEGDVVELISDESNK